MKYKLKYSPDSRDKLKELSRRLSVEAMLGIPTPYRFLRVKQNYVFYRIEQDTVYIADIYNEREDCMWRRFRVNLRTQDSIDFWGE